MAELTVTEVEISGTAKPALAAITDQDNTFDNDGKTYMEVDNASGGNLTVIISGQVDLQHGISADETVVIPTGETHLIGPFPERFYNTDGANEVAVNFSTTTSVTVGIFSARDIHA